MCSVLSKTHRFVHVRTFWRDVLHGGRQKLMRTLTVQCSHCAEIRQIETMCGREDVEG